MRLANQRSAPATRPGGSEKSTCARTEAFLGVIAIVVLSLLPATQGPSLYPGKYEHFAAYALVGFSSQKNESSDLGIAMRLHPQQQRPADLE
jgi:hypothetical protein